MNYGVLVVVVVVVSLIIGLSVVVVVCLITSSELSFLAFDPQAEKVAIIKKRTT